MSQPPMPPSYSGQQPYQPMQPMQPASRGNGMAIASLICGLLGCLALPALLAAIFGILGIKKSNQPGAGGKGMAIAGLVLGIIGILGWAGFGTFGFIGWRVLQTTIVQPGRAAGTAFLNDLSKGDLASAKTYTTPEFSSEKLATLKDQLQPMGQFKEFKISDLKVDRQGSAMLLHVQGTASFANDSKAFSAELNAANGKVKISDFQLK